MKSIPKILIACPTSDVKNYCVEEWLQNLNSIRWAKCDVLLIDNSNDLRLNSEKLRELCEMYIHTKDSLVVYDNPEGKDSINAILASGHNKCREYALKNGYEYLFHLESDVFPDPDVLEKLVFHKKQVVNGLYYRDEGKGRKPMVQRDYMKTKFTVGTLNYMPDEDIGYVDGTLKKVPHAGIGCCLIHKSVLEQIKFRYDPKNPASPDTYFAMDCKVAGIPIYLDTNVICDHKNKAWGAYGVDWK